MKLVSILTKILFLLNCLSRVQRGACDKVCTYHGPFNEIKHIQCSTGCCGSYHSAYCCINRHIGEIAAGSILGFIALICIVCFGICCYRTVRKRRDTLRTVVPDYGSISAPSISGQQDQPTSDLAVAIKRQNPNVWLTVTPPTPTPHDQSEIYDQPYPKS